MNMQKKFWSKMVQIKFEIFYFNEYIEQSGRRDAFINIVTAVTSSSSIAGWAIWSSLKFVWAVLIAVAQVANAIKSYLPYHKRIEFLSTLCSELSILFINCDHLWYDISNGILTNELMSEIGKK